MFLSTPNKIDLIRLKKKSSMNPKLIKNSKIYLCKTSARFLLAKNKVNEVFF